MKTPIKKAKLVQMASSEGHRDDYQRVLSKALDLEPSTGRVSAKNFLQLVRAKALLFGSLDDDVRGFLFIAFARLLAGKKTAGLFLRPQSCFSPSGVRAKIKHSIFRLTSKIPLVSVCTIIPFELEPDYRQVARQGLADPQLWDREILPFNPSTEFAEQLKQMARGRRIIAFIGTASPFKGVDEIRTMMAHPHWNDSVCVIFAGRVPEDVFDMLRELEILGAVLIPRFISNVELAALYHVADFIWAAYQTGYDQASGNFGRAMQGGKIPIVRQGALIARLAHFIDYPVLEIDFQELPKCIASLQGPLPQSGGPPVVQMNRWRDQFVETMKSLL